MSLHETGGKTSCLVEDPIANSFFRIGRAEWTFASQLDGKTSPQAAYQQTIEAVGHSNFPPDAAQQMLQWLVSNGLVRTGNEAPTSLQPGLASRLAMSAFFGKIPLCHPDRWLAKLEPYSRWFFSWPPLVIWCALVAYATCLVVADWSRFWSSASAYLAPSSWLYLLITWLILKAIHESFHGLACKRFGGSVGACGIVLILFSPIAFVDVTSSWRFRSKWQRIVTSAAGMYIEFAIAAIAAIIWSGTSSPGVAFACQNIVVAASVSSLLFNANPLMRFDGYYILADLLEVENLYGEGRQVVRSILRKHFLRLPTPTRSHSSRNRMIITIYGFASSLWRVLISLSLIVGAAALFHGAGLVIAAVGVVFWFAIPIFKFARFLMVGSDSEKPAVFRCLTGLAITAMALLAILCVPIPGGVNAPAVVRYEPLHDLRCESNGFVREVHVKLGDEVKPGQVLVTLENDKLAADLAMVEAKAKQSKVQSRIYRGDNRYPEYQAELEQYEALNERLDSLRQRVSRMTVKAPAAGTMITRKVDELEGRYVRAGDLLLTIAAEDAKEINVTIPEYHIEAFLENVGKQPTVMLGSSIFSIRDTVLVSVDPSATSILRYPILGAHNGGPLPVQPETAADEHGEPVESGYQLTSPRFYGSIQVPSHVAKSLRAGEIGDVRFTNRSETIGRKLQRVADRWIGRRLPGS